MKCVKIDDACEYDRAAEEMYQKSFQEVGARVFDEGRKIVTANTSISEIEKGAN